MDVERQPMTNRRDRSNSGREELILYTLLVVVGAMPIVGVLADGAAFGAEATIGLILFLLGAVGLIVSGVRGHRRVDGSV